MSLGYILGEWSFLVVLLRVTIQLPIGVFQRLLSKGFTYTKNVLMRKDYENEAKC